MEITKHLYGKSAVRLLKVFRNGSRHDIRELEVQVLADGNFLCAFEDADNSTTVPTDTMKNNIHAAAAEILTGCNEAFAQGLAAWLFQRYKDFHTLSITVKESGWERITLEHQGQDHAFIATPNGTHGVKLQATREQSTLHSTLDDLLILKSTGSGFANYPKCDLTVLPETDDRILATRMSLAWQCSTAPRDWDAARKTVVNAALKVFSQNYSPSVQRTLYEIAEATLASVPEIDTISLRMPNVHYVRFPLEQMGRENPGSIFYPTGDPYGDISVTVTR